MFVFKLHTFDKRLLKVEAASFFFVSERSLRQKVGDAIVQFLLLLYSLSLTVAMLLKLATFVSTFPQWGTLLSKMEHSFYHLFMEFLALQ